MSLKRSRDFDEYFCKSSQNTHPSQAIKLTWMLGCLKVAEVLDLSKNLGFRWGWILIEPAATGSLVFGGQMGSLITVHLGSGF